VGGWVFWGGGGSFGGVFFFGEGEMDPVPFRGVLGALGARWGIRWGVLVGWVGRVSWRESGLRGVLEGGLGGGWVFFGGGWWVRGFCWSLGRDPPLPRAAAAGLFSKYFFFFDSGGIFFFLFLSVKCLWGFLISRPFFPLLLIGANTIFFPLSLGKKKQAPFPLPFLDRY